MLKKWHYLSLALIVVILCLSFRNLWYLTQGSASSPLVDELYGLGHTPNLSDYSTSNAASVKIIGSDYEPEEAMEISLTNELVKYVLIVPHGLDLKLTREGVGALSMTGDRDAVLKLAAFLDKHPEFDGATGITSPIQTRRQDETKKLLEQSSCRFLLKNWTLVIRNSGRIHKIQDGVAANMKQGEEYQECNITESALLVRKKHFLELRWRSDYGSLSHLDFFLRSKGTLKIAKLSNCYFSQSLNYIDRGSLKGSKEFTDYSRLGKFHSILRIVRRHKIEWTKCSDDAELCPEKPTAFRSPDSLAADGFPICCDVVMDKLLAATVKAMNEIGMEYRITYGTLLGAARSRAIIPYSDDIDLAVHKKDNDNYSRFIALQNHIESEYRVAWKTKPPMSRVYPHFAPSVDVDTNNFFEGDSLESKVLFENKILLEMKKLFPIADSHTERRFVDMYPSPEEWFNGFSNVTINNRQYQGMPGDTRKRLIEWYGSDYMEKRPEKSSKTTFA
ncbi:hypothetical protein OS493_025467 [Desmophyllum pertusum]|uniref:LicD/FKTN/FKRP nucleotidyltransferase domain-containing protein n=1 Tax=Desmophyllum pertusum TaxID=174260 RepID=A0A9W9YLB2_9CNID|nr:hypothetical protein OS493_025467 [Desmophyllum pertusum]